MIEKQGISNRHGPMDARELGLKFPSSLIAIANEAIG
jgi:hypothetical protein